MILIAAIPATLVAVVLLVASPFNGVMATMIVKPFLDATWDKGFMGINLLMVISVAVPLLLLPRIFFNHEKRFFDMQLSAVGVAYLASTMFGISGLVAAGKFYPSVDYFFRVLSGFLGFYMFQFYATDSDKFRKLVLSLLIAGIFPVSIGLYQALTGKMWRVETTSLGMIRNVGMYHDAFTIRYYGFQTLTAILLYWAYFCQQRPGMRFILMGYGAMTSFVIYRGYSKTGILIFVAWLLIWSIFSKKIHWFMVIAIAVIGLNFATGNQVARDVERVFVKEISAYEGTMDTKYVLAGRTLIWKETWRKWQEQEIFYKVFGSGANPPTHNEYLRVLVCNGVIGLGVFILSLMIIGCKIGVNLFRRRSPLNVMAAMVFTMLLVDTIGLHPGQYPAYQWYVYGFITLALSGVKGLDTHADHQCQPVQQAA